MAQQLRVLAALTEDPGSLPSTHMAAYFNCPSPVSEDLTPSSGLHGHQACT